MNHAKRQAKVEGSPIKFQRPKSARPKSLKMPKSFNARTQTPKAGRTIPFNKFFRDK